MPAPARLHSLALALAGALDRSTRWGAWLVLPLALLLFLQWPLRDAIGAWSRQANDIAQWLFALYVALAVREATRRRVHMAAGLLPTGPVPRWRRLVGRCGEALLVLPWAIFVLVAGAAPTWRSLVGFEAFPDTANPLYFVIRCSAWLLALGVALQALLDLCLPEAPPADEGTSP
jgi:TRAP-type mannitol/chloroaromatic compound transport system permease small subunit